MEKNTYFHSVTLDAEKCKGCTNCMKNCPTEAIRIRAGKAYILQERCIDCGECLRRCPNHAKLAITDKLEMIKDFPYPIALPAPSLYEQFDGYSREQILQALLALGFAHAFEVAVGAERVSAETRRLHDRGFSRQPMISSACPAVVRLITMRFPNLLEHVLLLQSPMEVAAELARAEAIALGIPAEDIGIFFITPCPAKMTSIKTPLEKEQSAVTGAISMRDIHMPMVSILEKNRDLHGQDLVHAGIKGIQWARPSGEAIGAGIEHYLAVDGIDNVINILEEIEDEQIQGVDFIEALACSGGCVGGSLTVENLYVSLARFKKHLQRAKKQVGDFEVPTELKTWKLEWSKSLEPKRILSLSEDLTKALEMQGMIDELVAELPGIDCGACGAPSCRALAEDVVLGFSQAEDCVPKRKIQLEERLKELENDH